jgi:hypothetical protein
MSLVLLHAFFRFIFEFNSIMEEWVICLAQIIVTVVP